MSTRNCPPHTDSGLRCLVAHHDGPNGTIGPPCFICAECRHHIRPHEKNAECADCVQDDNKARGLCPIGHPSVTSITRPGMRACVECRIRWEGSLTMYHNDNSQVFEP